MSERGFVIVYCSDRSRRVRFVNKAGMAELTPFFYTPDEAMWYIRKRLGNSPYVTIKPVGGDNDKTS